MIPMGTLVSALMNSRFFSASDENVALASTGASAEGASRVAGDFAHAYGADLTIDGRYGANGSQQATL